MKTRVTGRAPINIALIKYWGKKDPVEVIPYQPSISLSLDIFETKTTIERTQLPFELSINGKKDEATQKKVINFLKHFTNNETLFGIRVETNNSGPTAAGLASSASGFAALAVTANAFFETNYSLQALSEITRKGSGSAIRSLLPACVMWKSDGLIEKVDWPYKDVKMGIVIISDKKKDVGSTEGMARSVDTSPLYKDWVKQSFIDAERFKQLITLNEFHTLGELIEKNALYMHEICETSNPPIHYLSETSYALITSIQKARENGLFKAYVTMDAGPNVKILCQSTDHEHLDAFLISKGFKPLWSNIDFKGACILDEI